MGRFLGEAGGWEGFWEGVVVVGGCFFGVSCFGGCLFLAAPAVVSHFAGKGSCCEDSASNSAGKPGARPVSPFATSLRGSMFFHSDG